MMMHMTALSWIQRDMAKMELTNTKALGRSIVETGRMTISTALASRTTRDLDSTMATGNMVRSVAKVS